MNRQNELLQTKTTSDDERIMALELILAAWDEGEDLDIPSPTLAYAALFTAMTNLVAIYGEEAVADMARRLEHRVKVGEFTVHNTRQ